MELPVRLCDCNSYGYRSTGKADTEDADIKSGVSITHTNKGDKPHEWRNVQWQDWYALSVDGL